MTVCKLSLSFLLTLLCFGLFAQTPQPTTTSYRSLSPDDQWEAGLHIGLPFINGDVDPKIPGFGGGLHVRKSLDHIFSVRFKGTFASMKNEDGTTGGRESSTTWIGGTGQILATLNNLRFNKPYRKINVYALAGIGVNNFKAEYTNIPQATGSATSGEHKNTQAHMEAGAGIAFRLTPKINLGFEYTVSSAFGSHADLLDGDENVETQKTTYRDYMHYPQIMLNFNLGGKTKDGMMKSEPLYWANPMAMTTDAITALEARPIYDPTDTDSDGVIDAIDDEDNSPAGARVDTKGVTLDSDGDKVPDYKDKEPHSPPGYTVDAMGVANVPKPITEADVNRIVDYKISQIKFPEPKTNDWFLPSVNFNHNRYDIGYSEYEKLYQVATVLKQNPNLKVVAVGHTDKPASETYNNVLSYNRAKAAIDFIVANYGVARDRLILNWSGEGSALIPVNGKNMANRRVEFRVAKGETEMNRPEGPDAGKSKMKMNKDAGF